MHFYDKYDKIFFINKVFNKIINYIRSFLTLKLNTNPYDRKKYLLMKHTVLYKKKFEIYLTIYRNF